MSVRSRALIIVSTAAMLASLVGCGGGGGVMPLSAGVGSVGVQISWPQRAGDVQPALVPLASESIKVEVIRDGVSVPGGTAVINRPHTQAIIEGVTAGEAILRAAMYPEPDGRGVAQARGEASSRALFAACAGSPNGAQRRRCAAGICVSQERGRPR